MYVMGIDVGTSSCKVGIFSVDGLVASEHCSYDIIPGKPGRVEIEAAGTWEKIKHAVGRVLRADGVRANAVRAVSFSSMGESVVPVRRDGGIAGPSILAHDERGKEYADALSAAFDSEELFAINPNVVGPQYTFAKLMWVREHEPELYEKTGKFLFWGDFLGFMFGADPYTTKSLANRSILFDVRKNDWSETLLRWSGLSGEKMGRIVDSGDVVGVVNPALAEETGLPRDMRIVAGGHDQGCNSLGCGCLKAGDAVVGMGTYECYTPTFAWPENIEVFRAEFMNIENHVIDGLYLSFLYNHSGTLVDWFRNAFAPDAGPNALKMLNAEIPEKPTRLLFLPHNEPPHWPRFVGDTSGVFVGLKATTTRGEMFKAVMEGICYSFVEAVEAMKRTGVCPDVFLASGGTSRSDAWMQMRADITGMPFTRLSSSEGSLTGAAMLAAVRAGMFSSNAQAAAAYVVREKTFVPDAGKREPYRERLALYRRLYPAVHPLLADLSGIDN